MKNILKQTAGIFLIILLLAPVSCKKYEDGPWFSIYSKKERATGNWRFALVRVDGEDITEEYTNQTVNMLKNGDIFWTQGYYDNNPWNPYGPGGEWNFADDKMQIEMHFLYGVSEEFTLVWDIIGLKYGDLRLERYEDGVKVEWRMWKPY